MLQRQEKYLGLHVVQDKRIPNPEHEDRKDRSIEVAQLLPFSTSTTSEYLLGAAWRLGKYSGSYWNCSNARSLEAQILPGDEFSILDADVHRNGPHVIDGLIPRSASIIVAKA